MKARILSYGISAAHDSITLLSALENPISISDFDAFVIDPEVLTRLPQSFETLQRRQKEISDLLNRKGGIVIWILRPPTIVQFPPQAARDHALLQHLSQHLAQAFNLLSAGAGSRFRLDSSARNRPSWAFFQTLQGNLEFTAFFNFDGRYVSDRGGYTLAVNSVGYPIALELPIEQGLVALVPVPRDVPGDRIGAAIASTVRKHYDREGTLDAPAWAGTISVPGADVHNEEIKELTEKRDNLTLSIERLQGQRQELLNYVRLLFGYGKGVLEPQVRTAFRTLGFFVPEPDQYQGQWDIQLQEDESKIVALGEVEGTEGIIDVDKFRQLLDYIQQESTEGRDYKGILIGNGWRLHPLDAPERQSQFSDHVLRGAARFGFCLLPTTELFKAVAALLESRNNNELQRIIRNSILNNVGSWSFQR